MIFGQSFDHKFHSHLKFYQHWMSMSMRSIATKSFNSFKSPNLDRDYFQNEHH